MGFMACCECLSGAEDVRLSARRSFCFLTGMLHSVVYQLVLSFPRSNIVLFIKEFVTLAAHLSAHGSSCPRALIKEFVSSLLIVTVFLFFFLSHDSG